MCQKFYLTLHRDSELPLSVMVTHQFLALSLEVRIL